MPMLLRKPLPYGRGSDWSCGYVNRSRDRQGRFPGERIFSRKVGQAIALCGLFEWAFGPRNPMKNWSSRIGGADPLVRGRRPRWADQGFFLNGEHLYFKGADVHQDDAGWGDAVADSGFFRDVKLVKDAGFQFIRGSHYPHNPAFADACDELGVLFWSENCFWGMGGRSPDGYWNASAYPTNADDDAAFEESVKNSLRDMIRINRNHPSIVAWSMCNEVCSDEWRAG